MKKFNLFSIAIMAMVFGNVSLMAEEDYPIGAAKGKFSVSENKQVYISQGNLFFSSYDYMGDWIESWNFHECDTAIVGKEHAWGDNYEYLIDLFGWGTSGFDGKSPYLTSTDYKDYFVGHHSFFEKWKTSDESDVMVEGYNYDWGSQPIKNGGNKEKQWRTPTYMELSYLLDRRTADDKPLAARGTIFGENHKYYRGYFVYPDEVSLAATLMLKDDNNGFTINAFAENVYVETLVPAGVIFLPCAGWRVGTDIYSDIDGNDKMDESNAATTGWYWTSESVNYNSSYCMLFDAEGVWFEQTERTIGAAVRLVQDVAGAQNIETASVQNAASAKKMLRNGQVTILRGEKEYTVLGTEL